MARRDVTKARLREVLFKLETILKQEEGVEESGHLQHKKQSSMIRPDLLGYTARLLMDARKYLEDGNTKRAAFYLGWASSNFSTTAIKTIGELHELID